MRSQIFAVAFGLAVTQSGVVLPVERASNVFFARTTINGQGPFWLTVDTGATLTVLDPATVDALGLATRPSDTRPDVGVGAAATTVAMSDGASIRVASLPPFQPSPLYVIGVRDAEQALGHRIDGVLGHDFLQSFVVELDYAVGRVTLHRPEVQLPQRVTPVRVRTGGNRLIVTARLDLPDGSALDARLLVDTGSSSGVSLNTPFATTHDLEARFPSSELSAAVGVNGMAVRAVMYVSGLTIGDSDMGVTRVALSRATTGLSASTEFDGVIGAAVLRRFRVVVDYPRRSLTLEPLGEPSGL